MGTNGLKYIWQQVLEYIRLDIMMVVVYCYLKSEH